MITASLVLANEWYLTRNAWLYVGSAIFAAVEFSIELLIVGQLFV